ncbi:MAG: Rne/Rng family ribonuclease [Planctomycetota bacterium]|jgi:ribonuclease E
MSREMLINVAESEECRVAVVEKGCLEELYVERASLGTHVGNIYKGKVVNIESGIQAAFIDFGVGKNGFLHVSDLHPRYFSRTTGKNIETIGRRKSLKDRPPIQDCLRKGKEIVVQVTKEGIKTKGATLSTYVALPGKYLVMMPWMRKHGVSHKIEDEDERKRLRQILEESEPPKGRGFIIRTAGQGASKRDVQNDLRYLSRLWRAIEKRIETEGAPGELYQESDLVIRALRDVFNSKITKIVCDSENVVRKIMEFFSIATPRVKRRVAYYDGKVPLFHKYKIENEIAKVQARRVELKGGGSIIIEQTEALVSIDVNSGRYRKQENAEETAYESNIEAAAEIARQLRLRDLGGLIICDFIDMRNSKHRKAVERAFRSAVKADPQLRRLRFRQESRVAGARDHPPAESLGVEGSDKAHRTICLAGGCRLSPECEKSRSGPDRTAKRQASTHSCRGRLHRRKERSDLLQRERQRGKAVVLCFLRAMGGARLSQR